MNQETKVNGTCVMRDGKRRRGNDVVFPTTSFLSFSKRGPIVELPSPRFRALPENEFAMLELARRAGISVPENKLIDVASIKGLLQQAHTVESRALAVKRFDRRPDGTPVHMEDFAEVFGKFPTTSASFTATRTSPLYSGRKSAEDAVLEFVQRLVFSVVIGNADNAPQELVSSLSRPAHARPLARL